MQLNPNRTLPEQTAERIWEYIQANNMKPGEKLPNEFQLADICGVGRSTVREAIKLLTYEGYVEVIRGNGTYLIENKRSDPDPADPLNLRENTDDPDKTVMEYFEVRLILEPEIASIAAANATHKDCRELVDIEEKIENLINAGENHAQADIDFHMQIAKCSKNDVLYKLMEIIATGIPLFVELTNNQLTESTITSHREIIEAIANGDSMGAKFAMIEHLNSNRKLLTEYERKLFR